MSRQEAPEDAEFAGLLRSVMADRSASTPPAAGWEPIRSRLRSVRRRRRIRSAARVGAGLLAVTAVITVVNNRVGTASLERSGPSHQPLIGESVRGSLRSDSAWLATLRQKVADSPDLALSTGTVQSVTLRSGVKLPEMEWAPPAPAAVRVIFAGDLAGYRLALVTGRWEHVGVSTSPASAPHTVDLQRWFIGPAGAQAKDLSPASSSLTDASPGLAAQTIQPASLPNSTERMKRTGLAVAIVNSRATADVRLAGPAAYTGDGKVTLPVSSSSTEAAEPGVYAAPIPADGAYRLVVDGTSPATTSFNEVSGVDSEGRPVKDPDPLPTKPSASRPRLISPAVDFSRQVSGVDPVLPDRMQSERGGPTPPPDVLRYAFGRAALYSGLSTRDSTYQLLSARSGLDTNGNVSEWTVLTAVTAPSGAHFVSVCEVGADGRGAAHPYLDAWKVVPSGSLDSLALAWPTSGIAENTVTPMGLVAFIGPRGASSVAAVGTKGLVVGAVALSGQVQGVDFEHRPIKSVQFRDMTGKVLAVAKVSAYAEPNNSEPVRSWPTRPR
jgi:hypothetical protein